MKLLDIDIENFGIFSSRKLQFEPGFQLVYGENEAGKSTLLQLIREILFGFPHQSPYAFESHQGEMAATALIELADGTRLRFRRRKGRSKTVVGEVEATGEPVDAQQLSRMLGSASPELYQHVFGFSLDELSSGEKSLAHANLNEALYGGSIGGLANFQSVRASLQSEHESFFSPRAKNRHINQLLRHIKEKEKELRETVVKPRDFVKMQETVGEQEARVNELRGRLDKLRRAQAHCRRVSEALVPAVARNEARGELEKLQIPDGFPLDGAEYFRRHRQRLEDIEEDLITIAKDLELNQQRRSAIRLAPERIEREPDIRHLQQQIGKIAGYRNDIPVRTQEAKSIRESVLAKLKQLDPNWGLDQLEQFQASLAQRETIESMAEELSQLRRRQTELDANRTTLSADVERGRRRLDELSSVQPAPQLEDLVSRQGQYQAELEKRDGLQVELQRIAAEIGKLRGKLDSPLDRTISNAQKLPVPMEATVIEFRQRFAESKREADRCLQSFRDLQSELDDTQQTLDRLEAEQHIPEREALLAQRARRNAGWQLIRQKYIRGKSVDEQVSQWLVDENDVLPDAYEREVATADDMADRRQTHAELVARREQLVAEKERLQLRLTAAQRQLEQQQKQAEDLAREWTDLWAPCGFRPLSPEAMLDWLRHHAQLLDKLEEQTARSEHCRDVEAHIGDFEDELHEALPEAQGSTQQCLAEAARGVEAARKAAAERDTYNTQLSGKQDELALAERELAELQEAQSQWNERWKSLLQQCGFPADWDVNVATKVLAGIGEARQQYVQAQSLERRVSDMQQGLAEFEQQVRQLCAAVVPELAQLPAEDAVVELNQRVDDAKQAARDQESLTSERTALETRRGAKQSQRDAAQSRLRELLSKAGVESEDRFHKVVAIVERHRELAARIESLTEQISAIRGTEDSREFQAALEQADADSTAVQLRELTEQLAAAEDEYKSAVEAAGVQRDRLNQLDGTSEALRLQLELESARSELASAVDRWAPLVLADWLMKQAIARFEREHQPEMMREVARLFARMTGERYVAIHRKLDEQGSLLVEGGDGTRKEPHQLSRGTREQLYLAIRLAYVHHYCRESEPLPLAMDDVLVNFDDERARGTLEVLLEIAQQLQIIFLTCHQNMVNLVTSVAGDVQPMSLSDASSNHKQQAVSILS